MKEDIESNIGELTKLNSRLMKKLANNRVQVTQQAKLAQIPSDFIESIVQEEEDYKYEYSEFISKNLNFNSLFVKFIEEINQQENISEDDYKQMVQQLSNNIRDQFVSLKKSPSTQKKQQLEPSQLLGKESNLQPMPEVQKEYTKKNLSPNELKIQARYKKNAIDLNYGYNGFLLENCLRKLIWKYLTQNWVMMIKNAKQTRFLEQIQHLNTTEAGNYYFNPLCDVVELYFIPVQISQQQFEFKLKGSSEDLIITFKQLEADQWNRDLIQLNRKSSINELVQYVCNKRQAPALTKEGLLNGIKIMGGATKVQDLFPWTVTNYDNLKVKTTFSYLIYDLVNQIKEICKFKSERPLDNQRKECIKIANSHKILRYAVYKIQGQQGAKKIAWLNMQNLKRAVEIVKKQIHNKELLHQLEEYFNQFALDPSNKPQSFSRGMILFGPPGTGKTVLTESLPNIIGFHLIEKGLSAADFSKSLVGQTSRMIQALVNRASLSPYLLCSIGIDEVDGLVPDRKDKDQKNKGEGISILLSVIGGNKDVPNLIFMTSTNYIKKIDQAISRRFSGKFQVGRPNPQERGKIVKQRVDYLKNKQQLMQHLIKITTNFTGAALGGLANSLIKILKIQEMNKKPLILTKTQITDAAIIAAKQYNLGFGVYTLPQIYRNQQDKKFIFTQRFLDKISKHFLLVQHHQQDEFRILYANQIQRFFNGQLNPVYQIQEDKINVEILQNDHFGSFVKYVMALFEGKKCKIEQFRQSKYQYYPQYLQSVQQFVKQRKTHQTTVLIIEDLNKFPAEIIFQLKLLELRNHNLYIIYYISSKDSLKETGEMYFGTTCKQFNVEYTGRIMVQLNQEQRMVFQLKNCMQSQSKVAFRYFLKSKQNTRPQSVIPQLVDFFTKQQANYLLLIDYDLLLRNDAFEEKKIMEVLQQKMLEAKNYSKSAVIIDIDSMILLNQNASDSNFGRSMSYSIQNYNLFQILISYMRTFASTEGGNSRWITMIVKHPELVNILKKQLSWPMYPEEIQKQEEEKRLDEQQFCVRCNAHYSERQNKKQRKCMQHPGKIIDTTSRAFEPHSALQLKAKILQAKRNDQKADQNRYVYACCLKGLNEQGEVAYHHITQEQHQTNEDQLHREKIMNANKWNKSLKFFGRY